jgi:hypothetical protein
VLSIFGGLDGAACAFGASGAASIFWTGFSFSGVVATCSFTDAAEASIFPSTGCTPSVGVTSLTGAPA